MQKIEFQVKLKTEDLFQYTLRHTYLSVTGVFGILISFAALFLFVLNLRVYETSTLFVLLFVALLFPVIQPLLLYIKCRKQVKKNEDINDVLYYTLTEDVIQIRQEEKEAKIHWYEIRKAVYLKNAVYLYMSPVRAFIFPKEQCREKFQDVIAMIGRGMEKYRDYDPDDDLTEDAGQEQESAEEDGQQNDAGKKI